MTVNQTAVEEIVRCKNKKCGQRIDRGSGGLCLDCTFEGVSTGEKMTVGGERIWKLFKNKKSWPQLKQSLFQRFQKFTGTTSRSF